MARACFFSAVRSLLLLLRFYLNTPNSTCFFFAIFNSFVCIVCLKIVFVSAHKHMSARTHTNRLKNNYLALFICKNTFINNWNSSLPSKTLIKPNSHTRITTRQSIPRQITNKLTARPPIYNRIDSVFSVRKTCLSATHSMNTQTVCLMFFAKLFSCDPPGNFWIFDKRYPCVCVLMRVFAVHCGFYSTNYVCLGYTSIFFHCLMMLGGQLGFRHTFLFYRFH